MIPTSDSGEREVELLGASAFDELLDKAELADSLVTIDRSMADRAAGWVRPFREALERIAQEELPRCHR